jgi:hypothetical protein
MPGPGSRFGHDVTMRQRSLPLCANAGVTMAGVAMAAASPARDFSHGSLRQDQF